jgi:N6-adenosine-specific RNA methylase IME4
MNMEAIPRGHYGAILADPPWQFMNLWNTPAGGNRDASCHYGVMSIEDIAALPVRELATDNCALFMWGIWVYLPELLDVISAWGFRYKTCAFNWTKAHTNQLELFRNDYDGEMGLGYWTRANTEPCLLATRGSPKRLNADVRQAIIEPRREHSRKPDCVHGRIERLVAGPYLELFARQQRPGWTAWGNEVGKFNRPHDYDSAADLAGSLDDAYAAIREREASGGPGWEPKS